MNPHHQALLAAYTAKHNDPPRTWLPNKPKAIKRFQRFHGLTPDGIVGPQTRQTMRETNTHLGLPPKLRRRKHAQSFFAEEPANY